MLDKTSKTSFKELDAAVLPSGRLELEWSPVDKPVGRDQRLLQDELWKRIGEDYGSFLLFLGFCDPSVQLSVSLDYWRKVAGRFAETLVRTPDLETLRHKAAVVLPDAEASEMLSIAPFMSGSEYLNRDLLDDLWSRLNAAYQRQIKSYKGPVADFVRTLSPKVHLVGRVFFHLVESKKDEYPFVFLATYSTALDKKSGCKHVPLKHALAEYGADSGRLLDLLATVHQAAAESQFLSGLLDSGEIFHPLALSAGEAYTVLKEIPIYERAGILCRIPNWWKDRAAGLRLNIQIGESRPSALGMDAILDFDAGLLLGDAALSEEEARRLLDESEGLAFIKGKWVEVDRDKLEQTLHAYEKAQALMAREDITLREAMRLQLDADRALGLSEGGVAVEVSQGQWLESVVSRLRDPHRIDAARLSGRFKATLRPYQRQGVDWLCFLDGLQFGALLADDMGLGKTVELLAMLSARLEDKARRGKRTSLLVLPASLISNWTGEIERFLPSLRYFVAHPSGGVDRKVLRGGPALDEVDLVITTYGLCQKYAWLQHVQWDLVILDEAQAIKNPGTQQTRAVKELRARNRIIMTGTPVENRLSDLWSLFDFLNPGLLGTAEEFGRFSKKLNRDSSGYARLKTVVGPYILRRLKTDKTVISDLPEKIEMKTYAELGKKQLVLYEDLVKQLRQMLEEQPEGIRRRGLILASLMKFKQLCNHPDQYLGQGGFAELDSGKFQRLRPICETIFEKREKMLVFTQFKEMTGPLKEFLQGVFGHEGLVLHGGTPVAKRRQMIERFQSDEYTPFMVLSLKAGGVGLNLTAANHVVHFDRWWNPAVEDQATDRAFRIGQRKNVVVHKFVTKGTVEEKIDAMLTEKTELSRQIIPQAGEAWITEMDDKELVRLFTLSL
ncbi:MAG: DEAD/DEAH box helicase [Solirubrobacterales bacterium]